MPRSIPVLFLALFPLLLASVAACGGGGGGGAPSRLGTLEVRIQDTPVDRADHVFVTIDRVEIFRTEGGTEVRETLVDVPAQYDLLVLQNGITAVLGGGQFPAGDYTSIRLIVGADSKQDIQSLPADQLKNYLVIDGSAYALVVPSGAQTGLKFNHTFTLSAEAITVLTFDFDVRRSVHQRGRQPVFNLRPTLRLIDTVVSGSIAGSVSTSDASPLPAGTVVSAQQAGVEVASAMPDPITGAYRLGPVLAGTYDLIVIAPGFDFQTEVGVVVTAQQETPGHDFTLTAASGLGDIDGTVTFTATLPEQVTIALRWSGYLVASTSIDTDTGAYGFTGVPVGTYDVVATDGTSTDTGAATVVDAAATTVDLTLP